ncbi:MAG: T9SS type A sorting domain-containing protein, partial [Saprospiraceae bacterium]
DAAGDIYLNTENHGVFKFNGTSWIQESDAQVNAYQNKTSYFHIDNDGKRWLNNNINLSVNDNGTIQNTIISEQTIEYDKIENIRKDTDGTMYFITSSDRNVSVRATDGTWSSIAIPTLENFENATDILYLASNDVYLGTNIGYHYYDGSTWTFTNLGSCKGFTTDSQGRIIFTTTSRVRIIDTDGTVSEYTSINSPLSSNVITAYGVDANDNIWVGSSSFSGSNLIQMISPTSVWTEYDIMDYPVIERPTGGFHFDVNGNVWVSSMEGGVIKFDGVSWTNPILDNMSSLTNTNAFDIESDAMGRVYFSHEYGVTTLSDNGTWEEFSIANVPNESSSESSTIQFGDDGTLWWGSSKYGVFAYAGLISSNNQTEMKAVVEFSVYPNPTVDYTMLDFTLEEKAKVNVSIYNNLGQLIVNNNLGELYEGMFQKRIELNNLPTGNYLIQLRINDSFSTKKIVIR